MSHLGTGKSRLHTAYASADYQNFFLYLRTGGSMPKLQFTAGFRVDGTVRFPVCQLTGKTGEAAHTFSRFVLVSCTDLVWKIRICQ